MILRVVDAGVELWQGCVKLYTHARACRNVGMSPLVAASLSGHVSCVEALILAKADVLQCDGM